MNAVHAPLQGGVLLCILGLFQRQECMLGSENCSRTCQRLGLSSIATLSVSLPELALCTAGWQTPIG